MNDEKRYYIFPRSGGISEYPAKKYYSPREMMQDGVTIGFIFMEEYELIGGEAIRLPAAIAEPAIEAWKKARENQT